MAVPCGGLPLGLLFGTVCPSLREVEGSCELIGCGAFGEVFKAVDITSGYRFAIKVVHLEKQPFVDFARGILHREIRIMQKLKHVSSQTHMQVHTAMDRETSEIG